MVIEDMEDTLDLLNDIDYFFKNVDEIEKKLKAELIVKEDAICDARHERELSKLNVVEIVELHKTEKSYLEQRRDIKDKLDLINTLKPYVNKFIEKGICGETQAVIKNIKTLNSNQENRQYTPRVLKWLKCAKKKKEDNKNG